MTTPVYYIASRSEMETLKRELDASEHGHQCGLFYEDGSAEVGSLRSVAIVDERGTCVIDVLLPRNRSAKIQSVMMDVYYNDKVTRNKHNLVKVVVVTAGVGRVVSFPLYYFSFGSCF